MTSLVYFVMSYNQLTGAVPSTMGRLHHLFDLELHNNYLTSLPPELSNLQALTSLSMGFNSLSGPLPSSIGHLSGLVGLFLENNQFNGTLPSSLSLLTSLKQLELDHNLFSGEIPSSLASMVQLETLHLNDNRLEGALPVELGLHMDHRMVSLFLSNNLLNGSVKSLEKWCESVFQEGNGSSVQCLMGGNDFNKTSLLQNHCVEQHCMH